MKKISKKDSKDFINRAVKMFNKYDAKRVYEGVYRYTLNTKFGVLNLSIFDEQSSLYSIYTRFDDIDRARQHYDCNPFNGKYNFHKFDKEECLTAVDKFLNGLVA